MLCDYNYKQESLSREIIKSYIGCVYLTLLNSERCSFHAQLSGRENMIYTLLKNTWQTHLLSVWEQELVKSQQKPTVGKTEVGGQIWRGYGELPEAAEER